MKNSNSEIPELWNLCRGLKALFHNQDIDSVIDSFCYESTHLYKQNLKEQLVELLRLEPDGYTIDQNESVAIDFSHTYQTNGIFEALAVFASFCCCMAGQNVVCRKESLLRWHEFSSLLSEDLLICAYYASKQNEMPDFAWTPNVATDREKVNSILTEELSDVHAHLVGSSSNFDVNWICLMNYIEGREHLFQEIENAVQNRTTSLHYRCKRRSYYTLSIIAAAIRVVLFSRQVGIETESEQLLADALSSGENLEACNLIDCIHRDVESFAKDSYGYRDLENGIVAHYDYAHMANLSAPINESCAYSTFTGERCIMYNALNKLYRGQLSEDDSSLFYIYLLIKHKMRNELIQNNDETGFRNFHIYDERKVLFVKDAKGQPDYMGLLKHLSVASMFGEHAEMRCLETRMRPRDRISKQIISTDKQVLDPKLKRTDAQWNYGYIFHFIKQADKTPKELYSIEVRHSELRKLLKKQARNIVDARVMEDCSSSNGSIPKHRILGIDAASSELAARPEVFAQAFRYCRRCVPNIGITYHIGEDFHDIVDGLRAIDECIRFLNLRPCDRLGHALAIGIDVQKYYSRRGNVITMPKQVALDNVVWLYHLLEGVCTKRSLLGKLNDKFIYLFGDLYGETNFQVKIDTYYKSWLLRGDDPYQYQSTGIVETADEVEIEWHKERLLSQEETEVARRCPAAQKLYFLYHHDDNIKVKGADMTVMEYTTDMIKAIKQAQKRILDKVDSLKLFIECNPTSNFRIGDIDGYGEHPIRKFYSKGLNGHFLGRNISSSINTDDKGVFATSIEREYALIAESIIKDLGGTKNAEDRVVKWLDKIRECSLEQRFT